MAKAARLTGSSFIRPARVGIAFQPTIKNTQRAATLATKCWGGVYFPFLDSSDASRSLRLAEGLDLDAIWALDSHPDSVSLSRSPGFFWRSFGEHGPFDPAEDELPTNLLSPDWALSVEGSGPFNWPTWTQEDPLASLFSVWFGQYEEGDPLARRFQSKTSPVDITSSGARIPSGVINFKTPVSATALGISYRGSEGRTGVMQIDPRDPQDLIHFWNLRASGANVFPWVEGCVNRLIGLFESWYPIAFNGNSKTGSTGGGRQLISLWRAAAPPKELKDPSLAVRHEWHPEDNVLFLGWSGHSALSTPFTRTFSVQVDPDLQSVSIPLPAGPPARYVTNSRSGLVAAQVTIYTEDGLRPGVVVSVPYLRKNGRLLDTMANFPGSFERIAYEGRAVGVAVDAHEVEIGFTTSLRYFEQMFPSDSWRVKHTEGGRLASRVIDILGGVEQYPGNQPAIRRVLDDAAKSVSGKKLPALIRVARDHQGDWPGKTYPNPENYPKNTVYGLLFHKLLQPFLEVRCPDCGTRTTVRPEALSTDMECDVCSERYPLGLALGVAPGGRNEWVYRLTGNLSADRVAEIIPVAATQSVLAHLLGRGRGNIPHAYGVILEKGKWNCEIDVVAMADGDQKPLVILGEVKSYRDHVDGNDLTNLAKVQEFLESEGIQCAILVAILRDTLSPEESTDLRKFCEGTLERCNGNASPMVFPIVLTGKELSVPHMHPAHVGSWDNRFNIQKLAEESCRRNLGLMGRRYSASPDGSPGGWELEWA